MNITFDAKNGFCPNFVYKNIKYFIQDKKINNEWIYSLFSINLKKEEIKFDDHDLALKHVWSLKNVKLINADRSNKVWHYTSIHKDYFVKDDLIIIKNTPDPLSGDYDNYFDCLKFSKKYVQQLIENQEPKQCCLF